MPGQRDKVLYLQRFLGGLYLIAGVLKPFPKPEDVRGTLAQAHEANLGTWVEPFSGWCVANPWPVIGIVAVAMIGLGIVYLSDRGPIRLAVVGNLAMLVCFVAVLHNAFPPVIFIDLFCAVSAILFFRRHHLRLQSPPTEAPAAA